MKITKRGRIHIRVTDEEKSEMLRAAIAHGVTLSAWMRDVLLRASRAVLVQSTTRGRR